MYNWWSGHVTTDAPEKQTHLSDIKSGEEMQH